MVIANTGVQEVRQRALQDAVHCATTGLAALGDRGTAFEIGLYSDMSVQVTGTFTGSLSVKIQGSNKEAPDTLSDTDWFTLDDPQGVEIAITAAGASQIGTIARWMRAAATAGSGGAAANVYFFGRRR